MKLIIIKPRFKKMKGGCIQSKLCNVEVILGGGGGSVVCKCNGPEFSVLSWASARPQNCSKRNWLDHLAMLIASNIKLMM